MRPTARTRSSGRGYNTAGSAASWRCQATRRSHRGRCRPRRRPGRPGADRGMEVAHLLGLLVPEGWTAALGVTDSVYRFISVTAGTLAGVTVLVGLVLLVARRILHPAVRRTTTTMDVV